MDLKTGETSRKRTEKYRNKYFVIIKCRHGIQKMGDKPARKLLHLLLILTGKTAIISLKSKLAQKRFFG